MTQQLTRDAVTALSDSLGEPGWLTERRLDAFDVFEKLELPDPKSEEWRYTDVRGFDFDAFAAPSPDGAPPPTVDRKVASRGVIFTDFGPRTRAVGHPAGLAGRTPRLSTTT